LRSNASTPARVWGLMVGVGVGDDAGVMVGAGALAFGGTDWCPLIPVLLVHVARWSIDLRSR
jgi:hypothetical protein